MPHYNLNNSIYWFDTVEDASQYQPTAILITDEEADAIRLSQIIPPTPNELILAQIAQLEASITNRRIREAALTVEGKDWLLAIDAQITALRGELNA